GEIVLDLRAPTGHQYLGAFPGAAQRGPEDRVEAVGLDEPARVHHLRPAFAAQRRVTTAGLPDIALRLPVAHEREHHPADLPAPTAGRNPAPRPIYCQIVYQSSLIGRST